MKTDILYCSQCGAANDESQVACFACGQPLTNTEDNDQPFLIQGRYRLLSQVGTGGFGAVYKVADTHSQDSILALKQINLRGLSSQQVIEATDAFNREVALLSHLKHPNLPRVYDHFTDPEHWYLTMDFIEGDTLEAYLERQCATRPISSTDPLLPLPELLDIALQLCAVLGYLHSRQPAIIFRDLKPSNIMLTPRRQLYLIDFGIARHFKPGQAKDTIPFGSPGYAAPEQYGKAQTTSRSDIYSLGALLHYLLSGIDPADNPFHFSPLRLIALPGATQLEDLVMAMVSLHMEHRPPSISLVEATLREIANLQPTIRSPQQRILTPPASPAPGPIPMPGGGQVQVQLPQSQPPTRLTRRSMLGLAVAGTAVAALGGTLTLGLFQRHQVTSHNTYEPQSPPKDTQARFANFTSDGKYAAIAYNNDVDILSISKGSSTFYTTYPLQFLPYSLAISPDGSYIGISDMGGHINAWNTPYNTQILSYHAMTSNGLPRLSKLAWSPDNQYLARSNRVSEGGFEDTIDICDPTNNARIVRSCPGIQNYIVSLAWSPDGTYIAAIGDTDLYVWNAEKPAKPLLGTLEPNDLTDHSQLIWSPDSRSLAYCNSQGNIEIWSLQHEKLQRRNIIPTLGKTVVGLAWSPDSKYLVSASPYQLVLLDTQKGIVLDQRTFEQFIVAVYWPKDYQGITVLTSAGQTFPIDLNGKQTSFGEL